MVDLEAGEKENSRTGGGEGERVKKISRDGQTQEFVRGGGGGWRRGRVLEKAMVRGRVL